VTVAGLYAPDGESISPSNQSVNAGNNSTGSVADNPWGKSEVVVGIEGSEEYSLDMETQTESAIQYWETNGSQYSEYSVNFVLEPEAENPDLVVNFTDDITTCGYSIELSGYYGCAPVLTEDDTASNEMMYVDPTKGPRNLQLTLRHEFGHVLGLDHRSEPYRYMAETGAQRGVTDAANRSYPWYQHGTISVTADERNLSAENGSPSQTVQGVVRFYQQNPQYLPDNYSIEYVDDSERADIVLSEEAFGLSYYVSSGSQATSNGVNLDRDPESEFYTYVWIQFGYSYDLEKHTGYWIGKLLGNNASELPEQYRFSRSD